MELLQTDCIFRKDGVCAVCTTTPNKKNFTNVLKKKPLMRTTAGQYNIT
jgi:hypothetical protein